jgi:uncharacterized protein (TIGR00725 family)
MDSVAVFGSSMAVPGDALYDEGIRCGRLLAEAGFAVATGGYAGLMEAVSLGAREAEGHAIGITAPSVFPERIGGNAHLTHESAAEGLLERIQELADTTVAAIALPGSLGTATELLAAWDLAYVTRFGNAAAKPVVAVGEPWATLVPLLTEALATDGSLVTLASDVDEAVAVIVTRLGPRR